MVNDGINHAARQHYALENIGDSFLNVRKGLELKKEIYFIYVFFGISWALFNLYPLISRDIPLSSFGEMMIIDFLMLTIGSLFYKFLLFEPGRKSY